MFVALPAVYFWLDDYKAGGLREAEQGEAMNDLTTSNSRPHPSSSSTSASAVAAVEDLDLTPRKH